MLTLSSPNLPATRNPTTQGGTIAPLSGSPGATTLTFSRTSGNPLLNAVSEPIPVYTGSTVSLPLSNPDAIGAVLDLVIEGITYSPDPNPSASTPTPGTFRWNPDAGVIVLVLAPTHTPAAGVTVRLNTLKSSHPPDRLPTNEMLGTHPDFFADWNIQGEVQFQSGFEEQPSVSMSFVTLAGHEPDVRSQLKIHTKLILYGKGYSVSSLQIERLSRSAYQGRWIQVQVQCTGCWTKELETLIKARAEGCKSTLAEYADRAGIPFQGDAVILNQPADTPGSATTTFRQELEDRARSTQSFVHYGSAIELRKWGDTRLHQVSTADVLSSIQVDLNATGTEYSDIRLASELRNTQWQPDQDYGNQQTRDYDTWLEDEDENFGLPPGEFLSGKSTLRTGGYCFDNGGETKERTRTLYRNGVVRKVLKYKNGFVYTTDATHLITGTASTGYKARYAYPPVTAFWRRVEESTETYYYDREGYLKSVVIKGWKLARYKQESDTEACSLQIQIAASNSPLASRQLPYYQNFFPLNFSDTTTYTLASLRERYPDIKKPKDDSTWVEPRYARRTLRKTEEQVTAPNPRTTAQKEYPPLVTGKRFKEEKRVIINYPPEGTTEENWVKEYEQYTLRTLTESAEGEAFRNATRRRHRTENLGRPGQHTRIEIPQADREDCLPAPKSAKAQTSTRYLLNTPGTGLTPADPEEGTLSFPGVFDSETGRKCAQALQSIENTRNAEAWSFTQHHSTAQEVEAGDRLSLLGQVLVVFNLSETRQIQGSVAGIPLVTSSGVQLTLGRFLEPEVTLTLDTD